MNETLKTSVVAAGILTNAFAIFNRNAFECKDTYKFGYQAAKAIVARTGFAFTDSARTAHARHPPNP